MRCVFLFCRGHIERISRTRNNKNMSVELFPKLKVLG